MTKMTIAIDGHSSTGKSTIAKYISKELNYLYVDSGAMYRAVTLYAIQNGFISDSEFRITELISDLSNIQLDFKFNSSLGFSEIYLNSFNVENKIRSMAVANLVSKVSAIPEVRSQLIKEQHRLGENGGIVMDGRDIGTVVFPNATLKLFIIASDKVRAQRRHEELKLKGEPISFKTVLNNLQKRDYVDSHRDTAPLKKAEDAIEIDNSELILDVQIEYVMRLVRMVLSNYQ